MCVCDEQNVDMSAELHWANSIQLWNLIVEVVLANDFYYAYMSTFDGSNTHVMSFKC